MDALASSTTAARACTAIDNSSNLYLDCLVQLVVQTAAGSLGTNPVVYVYAYGVSYSGNYTDQVTDSDAAYTLLTVPNLKLVQIINVNTANTALYSSPFSIAAVFGGVLPSKWGVVVNNQSGLTLAGSANGQVDNIASYFGVSVTNS